MYEEQNGKCYYCGHKMYLPPYSDRNRPMDFFQYIMQVSIEHIQPRSKGGYWLGKENIALACIGCNWTKNNMTEKQFKNKIALGYKVPQPWVVQRVKDEVKKYKTNWTSYL